MISSYCSLIEFISALYFTMCLDYVLKNVWTRPGYARIHSYLQKNNRGLGDAVTNYLITIMKGLNERHQSASKKMAFFMVMLSAITLFVCGYIDTIDDLSIVDEINSTWAFLVAASVFILFVLWRFLKKRWYIIISYSFLCVVAFSIISFLRITFCIPYATLIILLFLSLPVALFLVGTLFYSSYYLRYLVWMIRQEDEFLKRASLYAFEKVTQERNDNIPLLPKAYVIEIEFFLKSYDQSNTLQDLSSDADIQMPSPSERLNVVFRTRLVQLFETPSFIDMVKKAPRVFASWKQIDELLPVNEFLSDESAQLPDVASMSSKRA